MPSPAVRRSEMRKGTSMALVDPHSYADDTQPVTKHLRLHLAVDFERKRIDGRAVL